MFLLLFISAKSRTAIAKLQMQGPSTNSWLAAVLKR